MSSQHIAMERFKRINESSLGRTENTGGNAQWDTIEQSLNNVREVISDAFEEAETTGDLQCQGDMDQIADYLDRIEGIVIDYVEPETGL